LGKTLKIIVNLIVKTSRKAFDSLLKDDCMRASVVVRKMSNSHYSSFIIVCCGSMDLVCSFIVGNCVPLAVVDWRVKLLEKREKRKNNNHKLVPRYTNCSHRYCPPNNVK